MTFPDDARVAHQNEVPAGCTPQTDRVRNTRPWLEPADSHAPVVYDKVDRRLMDTFPASDAVAQY